MRSLPRSVRIDIRRRVHGESSTLTSDYLERVERLEALDGETDPGYFAQPKFYSRAYVILLFRMKKKKYVREMLARGDCTRSPPLMFAPRSGRSGTTADNHIRDEHVYTLTRDICLYLSSDWNIIRSSKTGGLGGGSPNHTQCSVPGTCADSLAPRETACSYSILVVKL